MKPASIPFLLLLLVLYSSGSMSAQSNKGTNFYGKDTNTDVCEQSGSFLQDEDVERLITDMLARTGAKNRFILQSCSKIDNCQAVIFNGKPYILYNTNFLNKVKSLSFTNVAAPTGTTSQDWRALGILAHELGHHANNHLTNRPPGAYQTELELEADEYAGHMLYLMGATLTQAQACIQEVPERGTYTHPGRKERLAAIETGYNSAKSKEKVSVKEKIVNVNIDDRDGDGLANNIDKCPDEKGPPRNDGCPEVAPKTTTTKKDLPNLPEMVFVKGGTFTMGDTFGEGYAEEKPTHEVTLSDYYIGKYEVTLEQFKLFVEATGYKTDAEKRGGSYIWNGRDWELMSGINWRFYDTTGKFQTHDRYPVLHVSWNDAVAYAEWASEISGKKYKLPTEAQWEYAARAGGVKLRYGNGKNTFDMSELNSDRMELYKTYYVDRGEFRPLALLVGSFLANSLGLHDMSGNVWEWCSDWYGNDYYQHSPKSNPQGPSNGTSRVLRGGGWIDYSLFCRTTYRYNYTPEYSDFNIGFRLVVVP